MTLRLRTRAEHWLLLFWLAGLVMLAGCRQGADALPSPLHLNVGMEPATLDPALATDPGSQQISRMLFMSLVNTDPATGGPQHALAISWAVSPDGLLWEFKLRDDVMWVRYNPVTENVEQKRPVTADDVLYSFRRIFDPRVGSSFAPFFAPLIRGASPLLRANPSKVGEDNLRSLRENLGVLKIDDTTVRFILVRPASYFPTLLSTWLGRTQPREAIEAGASAWTEPGSIWTNGPYVLASWSHGREIVLKKNAYWYDSGLVSIPEIDFAMISTPAIVLDEYRKGNLDSLDPYAGIDLKMWEDLKEDPSLSKEMQVVPTLCSQYYGFNTAKPPFDDVRVRKAFAAALDRDTLVSSVIRLGEPARWFGRPGPFASLNISDTLGIPFNVNVAHSLLKDAGYGSAKGDKRLPIINLGINSSDDHKLIADTIAQMWKTNLGVEVRVTEQDWKTFQQTLQNDPPNVFRFGYCAYYPDAADFAGVFRSGSPDNHTRWTSGAVDQAIDRAALETDIENRRVLYRAVEKALVEDDVVLLPLWWTVRVTLTRPNVRRTYAITDGYERLETWSFK